MNEPMLLKQSVGFLKVSDEQPYNRWTPLAQVGKEATAKQVKISGGDQSAAHLFREDRHGLHDPEPGDEQSGPGSIPEEV